MTDEGALLLAADQTPLAERDLLAPERSLVQTCDDSDDVDADTGTWAPWRRRRRHCVSSLSPHANRIIFL